jgi:hypothetical protein
MAVPKVGEEAAVAEIRFLFAYDNSLQIPCSCQAFRFLLWFLVSREEPMDPGKAVYIIRYYGHFRTMQERLAHRHLVGTIKATGRSDATAQLEARNGYSHLSEMLSDDPDVLSLTSAGWEAFILRTAERIFDQHRHEMSFNYCCRCGVLARTPKAKQCRSCGNDWHTPRSS